MKKSVKRILALVLVCLLFIPLAAQAVGYENGYIGGRAEDGGSVFAHGVDLSEWQGQEVDFDKIYEQGYRFVILRAGFAQSEDACFEAYYTAAKAAGLDVGVYLYSYATSEEAALAEAQACKSWLAGKQLEYPVYYDIEDPQAHAALPKEQLTALAMTFLNEMARDGWLVGLYACKSWLADKLDTQRICEQYECWMALYLYSGSYETGTDYSEQCGMWQYSCTGAVDGITGPSDLNVTYKDYPSICREYGFNGYTASGAPLSISGFSAPELLAAGDSFQIAGRVNSAQGNLSNVTIGVYDEQDTMVTGRSAGPKTKTCNLADLAAGVKLTTLPEGEYTLRVTATNTAATRVLFSQPLTVTENGAKLFNGEIPVGFKEGSPFALNGTVRSGSELTSVTLTATDEQGKVVCSATAYPETTELELQSLDASFALSALPVGSYTYQVTAKTTRGTQTLYSSDFAVWVKNDPIVMDGFSLQETYVYEELQGFSGTVSSSDSKLTRLQVLLKDASGEIVSQIDAVPLKKTVSLKDICQEIFTEPLPYGVYSCEIIAENAGGPVTLRKSTFRVLRDGISLCDGDFPIQLQFGDSVSLCGTIASDISRLEYVNLSVYDSGMNAVINVSAVPQIYAFDLTSLPANLPFSDLPVGEYRLRVSAENMYEYAILYDAPLFVSENRDCVKFESSRFRYDGMSYAMGDVPPLWGVLTSTKTELTYFAAQIHDQDGNCVGSAERQCNGMQADIAVLNEQLRLAALPEGKYSLTVTASNETGETCVAFERFTITQCRHSNIATGQYYPPCCKNSAIVCNSRCLDCGAAIRCGTTLDPATHQYEQENCIYCGCKEPKLLTVMKTSDSLQTNCRYVFAYEYERNVYILNGDGKTYALTMPEDMETLEVNAQMLWSLVRIEDSYAFVNARGEKLHFNTYGLSVAAGETNASILFDFYDGKIKIINTGKKCAITFKNNTFSTDFGGVRLLCYKWIPN